jgi:hypothetical protein
MSDLSDEIKEAAATVSKSDDMTEHSPIVRAVDASVLDFPYIDEARAYYGKEFTKILRRAYRAFTGGKPFEDPSDAMRRTMLLMGETTTGLLIQCIADGMTVGECKQQDVRLKKMMGRILPQGIAEALTDGLFNDEDFRLYSETTWGTELLSDYDSKETINQILLINIRMMGHASGYSQFSDTPDVNKIWDLWYLACQSAFVTAYAVGCAMGQSRSSDDPGPVTTEVGDNQITMIGPGVQTFEVQDMPPEIQGFLEGIFGNKEEEDTNGELDQP